MKKLALAVLVMVGALFGWAYLRRSAPPAVPFTRVKRETIVSTLVTNGKVEPLAFALVRAEREGPVERVLVSRGDPVKKGQLLVELDARDARADLAAAQSRITQARAEIDVLRGGGRRSEQTEIENQIARARLELQTAERELASSRRLAEKKAGTQEEVRRGEEAAERARLQIASLERRRGALVAPQDVTVAESRLQDAQTAASLAQQRIEQSFIRSPIDGRLYQFDIRGGAFLRPGDLVGSVGTLERLRVIIYVDEPELGRVDRGMPVTVTWDAQPGRHWKGVVEEVPTQIVTFGTRQVGEVLAMILNEDGELLPGTNVNVEVRSRVVENVASIPKETLRRDANGFGVFLLQGETVVWRPVQLGVTSVTRAQVTQGLNEGDAVALPTERTLQTGERVDAVFP